MRPFFSCSVQFPASLRWSKKTSVRLKPAGTKRPIFSRYHTVPRGTQPRRSHRFFRRDVRVVGATAPGGEEDEAQAMAEAPI